MAHILLTITLTVIIVVTFAEDQCTRYQETLVNGTIIQDPVPVPHPNACCDLCNAFGNCSAARLDVVLTPGDNPYNCTLLSNHTLYPNASLTHIALVARSATLVPTPAPSPSSDTLFLVLYIVLGGGLLLFLAGVVHVYRERMCNCCDMTPPGWRYTILSELGQGAFSSVYLVKRTSDGEKMALKLIPCRNKRDLIEAMNEYRTTLRLQGHSNLIQVHDMFTNWHDTVSFSEKKTSRAEDAQTAHLLEATAFVAGENNKKGGGNNGNKKNQLDQSGTKEPKYLCIVMPYYSEGTLLDLLTTANSPLPEKQILTYSVAIASALEHMHRHSVIHRDLKPANILLSQNYTVPVVTDFGLCRTHNGEYCHTRAGTLHYMAPEQADRKYTAMADMWALGCVIYGMMTRRVRQPRVRVMFMARRSPTFEQEIKEEIVDELRYSQSLCDFVLKLLAVKPSDRMTAGEAYLKLRSMVSVASGGHVTEPTATIQHPEGVSGVIVEVQSPPPNITNPAENTQPPPQIVSN